MKRKELFEFEDQHWLPFAIRNGVTNLINIFHKLMFTSQIVSKEIERIFNKKEFDSIVDLGSGSGGPMLDVIEKLNKNSSKPVKLILSDAFPYKKYTNQINDLNTKNVHYLSKPLNVQNINEAPKGLKTMIAAFHHLSPSVAKTFLKSIEKDKQNILIYELSKNNIPFLLWLLLLPVSFIILFLMALVMTLFVRPFTFTQCFYTYVIPIIPLIYAWDGQASLMRTYTFSDIQEIIGEPSNRYYWNVYDAVKDNGKKAGFFIIGIPNKYSK